MIWLTQDFELLSVLLRALTLSLEALTVGGVLFLLLVATPPTAEEHARKAASGFCAWMALALAIAQILSAAESTVTLMTGSALSFHEVVTADFFLADAVIVVASLLLFVLLRFKSHISQPLAPILALAILAGSVALSHAASRLDHRLLLVLFTAGHHLGSAAWIGAMPFLLVTMRRSSDTQRLHALVRRFSNVALVSVAVLVLAGLGMAWFYVGSWSGLYGSSYGMLVLAKVYLLLLILSLGAGNFFLLKKTRTDTKRLLTRLRRFNEVEIGLGFTAILVGASLTAQSPAADMQQMLTAHEVAHRLAWQMPSLTTPSFAQLTQRVPLANQLESTSFTGGSPNDAMDQAWSEYNHHWAGIIVLAAGIFAACASLLQRRWPLNWFRNWPLLFIGLAIFILLRADADAWPLGPRSFWGSFAEAEVLEHRIFTVLITAFALFEWAVATGRLQNRIAAMVFPGLCALGGAFLMTHSHSLGEMKEETLVEMSHALIALLGLTAGWARWLQLRLPERENFRLAAALNQIWPICLALVGLVLMDYRES
ncbi:putative copper resistance protein D [Silvibacterium bohemicum]|uniref:Putative copper resistance protein D n=1 Tax=Silvibacterium bohemicum TaxID=1577686 RepID=A0A841JYF6_9BACT|nr:CopD family protein [Silvibacterium bohemicum]MBB6146382.1 putative copper resistance protein D [Silvibacterium bohemicum]